VAQAALALVICYLFAVNIEAIPALQKSGTVVKNRHSEGFKSRMPAGINESIWRRRIPSDNPMTDTKVSLGRELYFDKRLSVDGTVSCATCHDPANAFTDHTVLAIGASSKFGARNAPTILNAMFAELLFWDGRAASLEEQAKQPLTSPFEMGLRSNDAVVAQVVAVPDYREMFRRVFRQEGITIDSIVKAIAAYERTQLSGNSPFDRFISGDTNAITEAQKRGWELFKGKAKCIECHAFTTSSPFFTDFKFHNSGIGVNDNELHELTHRAEKMTLSDPRGHIDASVNAHQKDFSELGRFLVTRRSKDIGAFKTPTLRDVELTTPYMHDGSIKTLLDVVRFYNRGGKNNPNLDEKLRPLNLNEEEMSNIVEFMRALTSDDVLRQVQCTKPQTRTAVTSETSGAQDKGTQHR